MVLAGSRQAADEAARNVRRLMVGVEIRMGLAPKTILLGRYGVLIQDTCVIN